MVTTRLWHGVTTLGALLVTAIPVNALEMFVGSPGNGACTHATIQDAVDAAALSLGSDVIYVAKDQTYSNQAVIIDGLIAPSGDDFGLTIIGGVADCSGAPQAGQFTRIEGGALPVFSIRNNSAVLLSHLELQESSSAGIEVIASTVRVETVRSRGNGRGIDVSSGSSVTISDSELTENETNGPGGGLRCSSSQIGLVNTAVSRNTADEGGGLWIGNTCTVELGGEVLISRNTAEDFGGGIFVSSSSVVDLANPLVGTPRTAILIDRNTALLSGGGMYLQFGAFFGVDNTRIVDNDALELNGGGAYLTGGSILRLARGEECTGRCAEISGNSIGSQTSGSAVYASNSEVYLFGGAFSGNRNTGNTAYPLFLTGSFCWFESVEVFGNRGPAVFNASGGSDLLLAFVSGANNTTASEAGALVVRADGSDADVYSSAFQNTSGFEVSGGGTIDVDCVMSDSFAGATTAEFSIIDDPEFADPAGGDLGLAPASTAVDYCDDQAYSPLFRDLQGEQRGHDHGDNLNGSPGVPFGTYDLGADEVLWFFKDGFESGNPGAWSATSG